MVNRFRVLLLLTVVLMLLDSRGLMAELRQSNQVRRPVGLVVGDRWLYVANRDSGSVSIIETGKREVVAELSIGKRLSGLVALPNTDRLLATDLASHQLLVLKRRGRSLDVVRRLPVSKFPVSICITADGESCVVASLWSRRLTVFRFGSIAGLSSTKTPRETIDLPFAPRIQFAIPGTRRVIVADSFGGRLAIVDLGQQPAKILFKQLHGHNIRGLAASHDRKHVYLAHQILNSRSPTTHEGVFWGGVIKNVLRIVPIDEFLSDKPAKELNGETYPLGKPSDGVGDPANVLVTSRGQTLISLSGVNRIAVRPREIEPFSSRLVGKRPTALAEDRANGFVYIANTLDDSISVFELSSLKLVDEIKLGPPVELSLAQRGEQLFHDARLSLDGWYSCHSCHTDGHTNGLLNDNFGDGTYGAPKRVISLLGTGETAPWAWNGSASSFGDQIKRSIHLTMQGDDSKGDTVLTIAAYLASLNAPPSLADCRDSRDGASIERGRVVFRQQECARCHRPPFYTSPSTYDVGLSDEKGAKQFNPPSLRGLSQRGPYFHDNRAGQLKDVFVDYGHGLNDELKEEQLTDLLAFLNSL